jgi:hypothetical protein
VKPEDCIKKGIYRSRYLLLERQVQNLGLDSVPNVVKALMPKLGMQGTQTFHYVKVASGTLTLQFDKFLTRHHHNLLHHLWF